MSEEYTPNFSVEEPEELLKFWRQWGYVVVRDVVDHSQIEQSIQEIWRVIDSNMGSEGKIKPDDATTWLDWPDKTSKGFIQPFNPLVLQQYWLLRQSPKVVKAFQLVLETEKVVFSQDRYGVMRPTKSVLLPDGTLVDRPEHKTSSNWLHWDQNGWEYPGFLGIQGLITLTKQTKQTGGFHCVPGFVHEHKSWFDSYPRDQHPDGMNNLVEVPQGDPIRDRVTPITCPPGCLVIWDSRMPHGNYPNDGPDFRIVEYITFSPFKPEEFERKKLNLEKACVNAYRTYGDDWDLSLPPKNHQLPHLLSPLGKKIFGFEPWE